jgi:Ser/Thr protein kinase RdoA (MazF antagonist)
MDNRATERAYAQPALEALKRFPIEAGRLSLVALSENVTFRVTDERDGAAYVLRLHRPGYHDLAELNSERVWLRALSDAGIAVPSPVLAVSGEDYVPVAIPATGETRYAGLTRWIEGRVVAELQGTAGEPALQGYYSQLGTIMASMHNQASGWSPPASFKRHAFDADGLMGEAPFWGRFWEHDALTAVEQDTLLRARERIYGALNRYGRHPTTFSMIHADLHLDNLVADGPHLTVIDFDDAGFGWHQYDIAVALYRFHPGGLEDAAAVAPGSLDGAFFDSYRASRAVSEEALLLVPMFHLIRGLLLIGWKLRRPEVQWPCGAFERIKANVLAECESFEPPC